MKIPGFKKLKPRKVPRKLINTLGVRIPKEDWRYLKACHLDRIWDPHPLRTSRYLVEGAPSGKVYWLARNLLQGGYSVYNPYQSRH